MFNYFVVFFYDFTIVFRASGHVERFTDWMCKDLKTGACLRADHLIKENVELLFKVSILC